MNGGDGVRSCSDANANPAGASWWWRRVDLILWSRPMIFIGILLSMATIAFLCWLLFTLAVFALPLFAGITAGTWAYGTGAGWLGVPCRPCCRRPDFAPRPFLFAIVRPIWARLLIAAAFVVRLPPQASTPPMAS